MDNHEREFFISLVRLGKCFVYDKGLKLEIRPLTIEQELESNYIFKSAFESSLADEIMTEYEVKVWMNESGLWTLEHETKLEGMKQDLEKLKTEIYNNRHETKLREKLRRYIRGCEKALATISREKSQYFHNTREGYALSEKVSWIIQNTTYHNNKPYDFQEISINYVIDEWQKSILSESNIRELAREEPWKSLWSIRENSQIKLFNNSANEELTINQKNIVIWSQIYDNIQESLDCPNEDVIKDDDLLDGWFIIQNRKRKAEKLEKEFEQEVKNEKIKNSSEIFIMANDPKNRQRIEQLNSPAALAIKQQRAEFIKENKNVKHHDLPDEKQKIEMQVANMMANRNRGGR
jgi:hypothetical protein